MKQKRYSLLRNPRLCVYLFGLSIFLSSLIAGCAQKFNLQPGPAPVINSVVSNGPLVIAGNNFDSLNSVVNVGGTAITGYTFEHTPYSSSPEILAFQSFTPTAATNNPAAITVTANGQVSNAYSFLFYPQINSVNPDTAMSGRVLTVNGIFFGNRTAASALRAYYIDGNQRKEYMTPDPTIVSWNGTTVRLTVPNYSSFEFGRHSLPIYFELAVSTDTTRAQSLYE